MFRPMLHVLALRRLGLTRPFRTILLVFFFGCFVAGLLYSAVVFHALNERIHNPHVHTHSTH